MSWECLLSMLSQTLIEEHLCSTSQCKLLYCLFNIIRGFIMGTVLCFLNLMLYCFCLSRGFLYSPDFEDISTGQYF